MDFRFSRRIFNGSWFVTLSSFYVSAQGRSHTAIVKWTLTPYKKGFEWVKSRWIFSRWHPDSSFQRMLQERQMCLMLPMMSSEWKKLLDQACASRKYSLRKMYTAFISVWLVVMQVRSSSNSFLNDPRATGFPDMVVHLHSMWEYHAHVAFLLGFLFYTGRYSKIRRSSFSDRIYVNGIPTMVM